MKGSATAKADRAPLFTLALTALAGLALTAPAAFELTRQGFAEGQVWRLLTGHLAHYSLYHYVVDAGTFLVLGWIVERRLGSARWALLLGAAALLISLAFLWTEPGFNSYRGLSGLDCAAFASAIVLEARKRRGPAMLLGALFAAKLAYEQISGGFLFPSAGLGDMGLPVLSAHTVGAAVGFAASLLGRRPPWTLGCRREVPKGE